MTTPEDFREYCQIVREVAQHTSAGAAAGYYTVRAGNLRNHFSEEIMHMSLTQVEKGSSVSHILPQGAEEDIRPIVYRGVDDEEESWDYPECLLRFDRLLAQQAGRSILLSNPDLRRRMLGE